METLFNTLLLLYCFSVPVMPVVGSGAEYMNNENGLVLLPYYRDQKALALSCGLVDEAKRALYDFSLTGARYGRAYYSEHVEAPGWYLYGPLWLEALKVANALYARRKRVIKRVGGILADADPGNALDALYEGLDSSACLPIFVTLTFSNDVLASTSSETRRRYVSRFLKAVFVRYVGNLDYGGKTGREHYHALGLYDLSLFEKVDDAVKGLFLDGSRHGDKLLGGFVVRDWAYGFANAEVVRLNSSEKRISNYLVKLTRHAIKNEQGRSRLIYSRG